mmetsp:Transcript_6334/g.25495  ORF Transcript_6334/g.25495 Transcript_6334/m.25495 type:complete len:249 (-) Transcript_6334:16-762(-)
MIADRAAHGEDAQHAVPVPEHHLPPQALHPLHLVGSLRLVIEAERHGAAAPAEHSARVAAVGHGDVAAAHERNHRGGPAALRLALADGLGGRAVALVKRALEEVARPRAHLPACLHLGHVARLLSEELVHVLRAVLGDGLAAVAVKDRVHVVRSLAEPGGRAHAARLALVLRLAVPERKRGRVVRMVAAVRPRVAVLHNMRAGCTPRLASGYRTHFSHLEFLLEFLLAFLLEFLLDRGNFPRSQFGFW